MKSLEVSRLNGFVSLGKLPSGGRVSAALGIEGAEGFTHIASCSPIHLPSKVAGDRAAKMRRWVGVPPQKKGRRSLPSPTDMEGVGVGARYGVSEHLPWEHIR